MANSTKIKDRIATVETTQQITNAMKLVSMSKYQHYRRLAEKLADFQEGLRQVPQEEAGNGLPVLGVVFAPDLGLASAFNKALLRFVKESDLGALVWLGNQNYDRLAREGHFKLLLPKIPSESMDLNALFTELRQLMLDYNIHLAVPELDGEDAVAFTWVPLGRELAFDDQMLYEPSYELANHRFKEQAILMGLYEGYYISKTIEHTVRRVAMDQASENADEMIQDLNIQYNRVRQEAITQEIAELMGGVE